MKKRLIITDLTRMKEDRVCIFGIDEHNICIRPDMYPGMSEEYAIENNIKPFNEIELNLTPSSNLNPPHTEDMQINKHYPPVFIRTLSDEEKKEFLKSILDSSVEDIFGAEIYENQYLNEGEGNRSLGTIKAKDILFVDYSPKREGKFNYRITFQDQRCVEYNLPVTDLAFRYCCDNMRKENIYTNAIGFQLKCTFEKALVFLRIGLARSFKNRHYLQISGVYTFPDYLDRINDVYERKEEKQHPSGSKSEKEKQQIQESIPEISKEKEDAKDNIGLKILSLIETLNFHMGRSFLASILTGSKSRKLIEQNIDKLEQYGILKGYTRKEAINVIDQIINKDYLTIKQSDTSYFPRPLLYLTDSGKKALEEKEEIELELPVSTEHRTGVSRNPELLNELKSWRGKVVEEENLPAYCIFHDTTLIEISNSMPSSKEDLMNIRGFGKKRIEKYGNGVLEIIREHKSTGKNIISHNEIVFEKKDKTSKSKPSHVWELGESNNPAVIPELIDYTKSKNANERRLAASALGKLSMFKPEIYEAVLALIVLLGDDKPQVRQYALKALGEIADPKAKSYIEELLSDEKEYNRKSARSALQKIDGIKNKIS